MKTCFALIQKEFLQIVRDFSSILIAFVLPIMILVLYRYGVNLDTVKITLGIKNDDINPKISTLIGAFDKSKYIKTEYFFNKEKMYQKIQNSKLKGGIIIPNNFVSELEKGNEAQILVITDGSEANLANYVQSQINIPLIHIADCVADKCKKKKVLKVGLLGTKYTMIEDFLKKYYLQ